MKGWENVKKNYVIQQTVVIYFTSKFSKINIIFENKK